MGKRSNFERIDKDFYRTIDPRAVAALVPFLDAGSKFVEPFAGQGDLVDSLNAAGYGCRYACELNPNENTPSWIEQKDAFDVIDLFGDPVISNPPWTRSILHKAIEHFGNQVPSWFLFDSDWAYTKQAAPYLAKYCTDIIAVGRLIWIPGTTTSGFDNCSWYCFDAKKSEPTRFYGKGNSNE